MSKISVDFDTLSEKAQGKIVKGSVIPRPIAWITTLNEDKSVNLAPFSFFTVLTSTLLAVSIQKNGDKDKDTLINLLREKEAVVHVVDDSLLKVMDQTSKPLAKDVSEVSENNLKLTNSLKVKTPGLKAALIRLEVTLDQTVLLTDYADTKKAADLVILRVVAAKLDESVYDQDKNYILTDNLKPVARLAGQDYGSVRRLDYKREF